MNRIDNNQTRLLSVDAFICFDTHEDRSFNALRELSNKDLINDVAVLAFEGINSTTDIQAQKISIKVEKDLSASILPCLREIDMYLKKKNRIGVDVSCMPIPFMAQILHFLYKRHKDKQITIYYTEPSRYTLNNLFDYSAYSGEIDIKTIPGFEGETSHIDEVKRVVFYIMGFGMTYLNKLIPQDVNPNKIAPINGFP
jgi:hypothetical protein